MTPARRQGRETWGVMKKFNPISSLAVALALPVVALAQDSTEPGKSSDALKNPPATAPARQSEPLRTPKEAEQDPAKDPGKSSDALKETDPSATQRQFSGQITAVSRENNTITVNSGGTTGDQTLKIGVGTKLKNGDRDGTWDDLKAGAKVEGTYRGGAHEGRAESVNIGG